MTFKNYAKSTLMALALGATAAVAASQAQARDIKSMVVAGGCFWCVESDFESVRGVQKAVSGYTGGNTSNPTYKTIKGSGHYEAVKITYDADVISYRKLLDLFFRSVDPTDAGGQFCDRGANYRSAIFVANNAEKKAAQAAKSSAQSALGQKIVTPILSAAKFHVAEDYHQNYYKGRSIVVTRFGPLRQAAAYKKYRSGCGRDARVKQLWGSAAPFVKG